jgi:hypothetical protein
MKSLLVRHNRSLLRFGLFTVLITACVVLSACAAPTWLTDAGSVIAMVGASFTSIASLIAGLTGNVALAAALATVSAWITKIQTGLSDIEELVSQYNEAANPTILSDIEAGLADVQANIAQDFSNLGLPAGVLSIISQISAVALSQLEAWGSLIPAIKAAAMTKMTITTLYTKAEYKAKVNAILSTPTGDVQTDAALAKVKKL